MAISAWGPRPPEPADEQEEAPATGVPRVALVLAPELDDAAMAQLVDVVRARVADAVRAGFEDAIHQMAEEDAAAERP